MTALLTILLPFFNEEGCIVHRVMRLGRVIYDLDHYCFPSQRRADRCNAYSIALRAKDWT